MSLSSCETELYALQMVAQEPVAFSNFCHRVYVGIGEMRERERETFLKFSWHLTVRQLCNS